MNGIRLETLMAAHDALMRAWHADYTAPLPASVQGDCMAAAVGLRVELQALGLQIEVKAEPPEVAPLTKEQVVASMRAGPETVRAVA